MEDKRQGTKVIRCPQKYDRHNSLKKTQIHLHDTVRDEKRNSIGRNTAKFPSKTITNCNGGITLEGRFWKMPDNIEKIAHISRKGITSIKEIQVHYIKLHKTVRDENSNLTGKTTTKLILKPSCQLSWQ